MILVESTLGNLRDPNWKDEAESCSVDLLVLEQWEALKSRIRKISVGGVDLAISLPRTQHLHDGDVLHYDRTKGVIIAASVALKDVLVIQLDGLETLPPQEVLRTCFELGHALGNQHWPAVIKGSTVYVPLSVDRKVMASVMRTHAFPHVRTEFVRGEDVLDKLEPSELRLLFGGADAVPHHHHGDAADHVHANGARSQGPDDHEHTHEPSHSHHGAGPHTHSHAHAAGKE